jgi:hypothetical protein
LAIGLVERETEGTSMLGAVCSEIGGSMIHTVLTRVASGALAGAAILTYGALAGADSSVGIITETISDYTFVSGGGTFNNTDANTEGDGFYNAMTASGTGYTALRRYKDNLVYDTDFYDPDLTGFSRDGDTSNFDVAGGFISLVIAHGICDDLTTTRCNNDSNCGANAYCPGDQLNPGEQSTCINESSRRIITSSTNSSHANNVWYGYNNQKSFALGESKFSGGYDGAGTNGGTNVAIIVNSCGIRSRYFIDDTANFFAGVHSVMMTMPVESYLDASGNQQFSDTAQWSARGSTLSSFILANILGQASAAWWNPTMIQAGHGFNGGHGHGANIVIGRDSTASMAQWHVKSESWLGAQIDQNDATGNGWWYAWYVCNYDCNTFGE